MITADKGAISGGGSFDLDRLQEEVKEAKVAYQKELDSIRNVRKDRMPIGFATPEIWKTSLQHFNERWPQWKAERTRLHESGKGAEPPKRGPSMLATAQPKDQVLPVIINQIIKNHI